jgi:peroxiredoxin Q/BCP
MRLLGKITTGLCILSLFALALGNQVGANEKGKAVKVGDKAPSFESIDENGKTFKSSSVVGKKVLVLYFYPADFTGGCTSRPAASAITSKASTAREFWSSA